MVGEGGGGGATRGKKRQRRRGPGPAHSRSRSARHTTLERDGYKAHPNDIFLTSGASEGISLLMGAIIANPSVGVMIPIPQYPLYSATITLCDGVAVGYYLVRRH